jgi:arylsulfatase A-like enzyme
MSRISRVPLLVVLAFVAALSLASTGRTPEPLSSRPDILLITIDSLRADALGSYGYRRQTSPNLDEFARGAVLITDAIAQAPFTKASVASLMTGLLPGTHKTYTSSKPAGSIMKRGGHVKGPFELTDALPAELTTLAEALKASGYRTVGLITNPYLIADFGYDQGFSHYRFFNNGEVYTRAPEVLREALKIFTAPRSGPVFVWVHLMDIHNPYRPGEPYRAMFRPDSPPQIISEEEIAPAVRIEGSRDVRLYRARYDACIRDVDASLGAFFAALRRANAWDSTAVVVSADHGEEFYEHAHMGHNTSLFDAQVRVPLLMKIPGIRPARLRMAAQVMDLYPTLIHLGTGRAAPASHGNDLIPVLLSERQAERYAFAELPGKAWTVRSLDWKLVSSMPRTGQLYHVSVDPGEIRDVAFDEQRQVVQLRQVLAGMISTEVRDGQKVAHREAPIDSRVLERLRALGYLNRQ